MKKFLHQIYLENKFKENADELKNCLMLLDLNGHNEKNINESNIVFD